MNSQPSKRVRGADGDSASELSAAFSAAISKATSNNIGVHLTNKQAYTQQNQKNRDSVPVNDSVSQLRFDESRVEVTRKLDSNSLLSAYVLQNGFEADATYNDVAHVAVRILRFPQTLKQGGNEYPVQYNVVIVKKDDVTYTNTVHQDVAFPFNYSISPRREQYYAIGGMIARNLGQLGVRVHDDALVFKYSATALDNVNVLKNCEVAIMFGPSMHGQDAIIPTVSIDSQGTPSQAIRLSDYFEGMVSHMSVLSWIAASAMPFVLNHMVCDQFYTGSGMFKFHDIDPSCPSMEEFVSNKDRRIFWYINKFIQGFDYCDRALKKWGQFIEEIDPAPRPGDTDDDVLLFDGTTTDFADNLTAEVRTSMKETIKRIIQVYEEQYGRVLLQGANTKNAAENSRFIDLATSGSSSGQSSGGSGFSVDTSANMKSMYAAQYAAKARRDDNSPVVAPNPSNQAGVPTPIGQPQQTVNNISSFDTTTNQSAAPVQPVAPAQQGGTGTMGTPLNPAGQPMSPILRASLKPSSHNIGAPLNRTYLQGMEYTRNQADEDIAANKQYVDALTENIMIYVMKRVRDSVTLKMVGAAKKYQSMRAEVGRLNALYGDAGRDEARAVRKSMIEDIRMYIMGNEYRHFLAIRLVMCVSHFASKAQYNQYLDVDVPERIYEAMAKRRVTYYVLRSHPLSEKNMRIHNFLDNNSAYLDERLVSQQANYYGLLNEVTTATFSVALASVVSDIQAFTTAAERTDKARNIDFLFDDRAVRMGSIQLFANVIARTLILLEPGAFNDMRTEHRTKTLNVNLENAWDKLKQCILLNGLLN